MKKHLKRSAAYLLCAIMLLELIPMRASASSETEISLWTYPIGGWGSSAKVDELVAKFEAANPDISVNVEYLTYADGDAKVSTAIAGGAAPDIVLAEPERIVASWSKQATMVDLSDMLDSTDRKEIYPNILNACMDSGNSMYLYPMAGIVHTMAINKTVFEAADAMKYINQDTHTWKSVDDFFTALKAVADYTGKNPVGVVYCAGQGGDQGTRALVTNLYGGTFTNAAHTAYTWDSAENIQALTTLNNCENLEFDASLVGGDEISLFCNGNLNVAFCWNMVQQKNPGSAGMAAGKTWNGDEIMFMAFPSDDKPLLQSGIWGFGIFDNGNSQKIAAAKTFVKYMCDSKATVDAVKMTEYFSVRSAAEGANLSVVWESDPIMSEYNKMMQYAGDYYQLTPFWSAARTSWWNMLQEIGFSDRGIAEIVKDFTTDLNAMMPEPEIPAPETPDPEVPDPEVPDPEVPDSDSSDTNVAVYRFYNPYTNEHLLVSDEAEKNGLVKAGWTLEGIAWNAPKEGSPVYRLYNPDDWHTYTSSEEEMRTMVAAGWSLDGPVSCTGTQENGKPVYRLFNPYEKTNFHLFTAGVEERDMLVNAGWILEGIAWYAEK